MKTTEEIWMFITQDKSVRPLISDWILEMKSICVEELLREKIFHVETRVLDSSYLLFLEEQIILEPRGPGWTEVLRKRLETLKPFANKRVVSAMVKKGNHLAFIKIDPERKELISIEDASNGN